MSNMRITEEIGTGKHKDQMYIFAMDDIGAKRIFQAQEVRKRFISAVLCIPVEDIKTTRLTNTHLIRRWKKDKEGILDIAIELNDNTKILIEVQVEELMHWDRRNLFYWARAFTEGVMMGEKYQQLKRCVSISVLDFYYLPTENCHTRFMLRNEEGLVYTDLLEVHVIEINKATQEDEAIHEWIELFRCRREEEIEVLRMKTKNPGILTAIEELREMNLSKSIKAEWDNHLKQKRDRYAREEFVYDQGLAAGEASGEVKGKIEAARSLLDILEPEEIAKRLDLPIDQVISLKEE